MICMFKAKLQNNCPEMAKRQINAENTSLLLLFFVEHTNILLFIQPQSANNLLIYEWQTIPNSYRFLKGRVCIINSYSVTLAIIETMFIFIFQQMEQRNQMVMEMVIKPTHREIIQLLRYFRGIKFRSINLLKAFIYSLQSRSTEFMFCCDFYFLE